MENLYKIKPSANILNTIGSEIIKDPFAAIIELVKNAYDADATTVRICYDFSTSNNDDLTITITDNGHGMSPEIVTGTWLVPATRNKARKSSSPSGRVFLGKKGIGRYASSILGNKFKMTTIDLNGIKTTVELDWYDFNKYDYLEDVPIYLEYENSNLSSGTTIKILHDSNVNFIWNKNTIDKLIKELRTLISPINEKSTMDLPFEIFFQTKNCDFNNGYDYNEKIMPINLLDFYNYRIYGTISKDGLLDLTYENACESIIQSEKVSCNKFTLPLNEDYKYCGDIFIDLRVFDRDPRDIDILKDKISNSSNSMLNKLETRQLLNEISGVNIYRNNFRIRPYGDLNYDWLSLDKDRVQNPSLKIGNNQVCGTIIINDEESSNLIERSSREGLKENAEYFGLLYLTKSALSLLETRRAMYRKKSGKGRKQKTFYDIIQKAFDFNKLSSDIDAIIISDDKINDKQSKVSNLIGNAKESTETMIHELNEVIATYQGQATLGKIVMILLHEGSKPIQGLRNMSTNLSIYSSILKQSDDLQKKFLCIDNIIDESESGEVYTNLLASLFKRIKPLAFKANLQKKDFDLTKQVQSSISIFEKELKSKNIICNFSSDKIIFNGYKEDILTTITNLIDNSVYWLSQIEITNKKIDITIIDNKEYIEIIYKDNGPGIDSSLIDSDIIFNPDFSTKSGGTGLGLAICGEAIKRNNGEIKAFSCSEGAYFTIRLNR
ncbi:sensor histidine kinase [Clostridium perfringens]|uniref:sensor histidine kinase n=1 Tax=Clostridium perfringens TaxID=1502 RepID=UPI0024BC039A|nr:sensor histidine kinase [Clostridium perfringens]